MSVTALTEVQALLGGISFPGCESPSLRLEKFVQLGNKTKGAEIDAFISCQKRCHMAAQPFKPKGAEQFVAKLGGRLIVNQAGGILENAGICLHPHFGYPYIPGSAVKGIARHAAWREWEQETDEGRKQKIARSLAHVFGYPTGDDDLDDYLEELGAEKHSGNIAFLAAVPDGSVLLVKDIVNCHHTNYYSGKQKKAVDNEAPNPQFFPAVEAGGTYIFTLVPLWCSGLEDMSLAKGWLVDALVQSGIGAKTAAGYGWFSYNKDENDQWRDKQANSKKQEEMCERQARLVERIDKLEKVNPASPEYRSELMAIQLDAKVVPLPQIAQEKMAKMRKGLPEESVQDSIKAIWQEQPNTKAIINSDIKRFSSWNPKKQEAIVLVLRDPDPAGIGAKVWAEIKTGQKGDVAKAVDAIRTYSKNVLKLGRMP